MTSKVSRRQLLLGGSALFAAGALQSIPGGRFLPSLDLMPGAHAQDVIPRPDYIIRMSSNENPWGPSRVALRAIYNAIDEANLYSFYGNPLPALISRQQDIGIDHISLGAGSAELLKVGGLLAGMRGGSIVIPHPTFEDLPSYAEANGTEVIRVPVDGDMKTDLEAMASAIRADTRLVYLCNPNNPIPNVIEKNALRDFILEIARDRMVFLDEAYHEFVDNPDYSTMMDLVRNGQRNLIITRTASKIHGLAGLRVGFAFSHPELAREITNRQTGLQNIVGVRAAEASYQDEEHSNFVLRTARESLDIVESYLDSAGINYIKSNANFSFIETGHPIEEVQARFLAENIQVGRPFPPFTDWMRLSMAKPDEMRYFVQTYRKLFA